MKITVVIDEKLLDRAVQTIGARSKREAIEAGLRELVKQANREALRRELGTFHLDLKVAELRRLRHQS